MSYRPRHTSTRLPLTRRALLGSAGLLAAGAIGAGVVRETHQPAGTPVAKIPPPTAAAAQTRAASIRIAETPARRASPHATGPATAKLTGIEEVSLIQLRQALDQRQFSVQELVKLSLDRIARLDTSDNGGPGLRAMIETNPDAAYIAQVRDQELAQGKRRGRLHGIPIVVKDVLATADSMHTTAGSYALLNNPTTTDAFIVDQLRQAGAIIIGKANMSEWSAFRSYQQTSGWSGRGGQACNPYQLDMSPWGSSSGSAIAVAASYVPVAIGAETDGSIMCPASACGVVGLKPTVGLVSRAGVLPVSWTQDSPGPVARSVWDAALVLNVIAGYDPNDPAYGTFGWAAPEANATAPGGDVDYTAGLSPDGLKGARIGICRALFDFDDDAAGAVDDVLTVLEQAGATLVDNADIPTVGTLAPAITEMDVLLAEFRAGLADFLGTYQAGGAVQSLDDVVAYNDANADQEMQECDQSVLEMAQQAADVSDDSYTQTLTDNLSLAREQGIDAIMDELQLDALIAPTAAVPTQIESGGDNFPGSCTQVSSMAGYPILTVPVGYVRGLPVGLCFMGRAFSEAKLLQYGYAFEQAHQVRTPPEYRTGQ